MNYDFDNFMSTLLWVVKNSQRFVYSSTWSRLQDRMWRKNRGKSTTLLNLLSNCKGVDLNRNFAYSWGELDILRSQGGTPLPCLETFIGDSPFSEVSGRASN